jgi:hypothetical protein
MKNDQSHYHLSLDLSWHGSVELRYPCGCFRVVTAKDTVEDLICVWLEHLRKQVSGQAASTD